MQIVRPKMTRATYQALKRYILRERERKKQEQEQDKEQERLKKERELKKKKEEEDSLTLEQTKEQIGALENKLANLKQEKHELFSQLKKVLHQENAMRQRAQLKEQQNEQAAIQQQYLAAGGMSGMASHPQQLFMQTHIQQSRPKYMNVPVHQTPPSQQTGIKRSRSPTPPPAPGSYQHYGASFGNPGAGYSGGIKQEPYCPSEYGKMIKSEPGPYQQSTVGSHVSIVSQASHSYAQTMPTQPPGSYQGSGQSPAGKYQPATPSSAFVSYPAHYGHQQKQNPDPYPPSGYPRQSNMQRRPQTGPGYMTTSSMPMQQQMEHGGQKSGYSDEKQMKLQQQAMSASASQQQSLMQGQVPTGKGSIMTGYPVVHSQQPPTSSYGSNPRSMGQPRGSHGGYGQQQSRY